MKNIEEIVKKKLNKNKIQFQSIKFLAGDASNRKYFKILQNEKTKVLMNNQENDNSIIEFIDKTKVFKDLDIIVPKIFENFSDQGFLIIEDFGDEKYSKIINKNNQEQLYKNAIDTLIHLHKKKIKQNFENYTKKKFYNESVLFFEWYLPLISKKFTVKHLKKFKDILYELLTLPMNLPNTYIHRDYHVDNLFFLKNKKKSYQKCGWIDYQDALIGTCVYDLMSLLEDARRDLNNKINIKMIQYYLENFRNIDKELFIKSFRIIAVQRHMKVLGIFARLYKRDKKNDYIIHIPRVLNMLKKNLEFVEFRKLRDFLLEFLY